MTASVAFGDDPKCVNSATPLIKRGQGRNANPGLDAGKHPQLRSCEASAVVSTRRAGLAPAAPQPRSRVGSPKAASPSRTCRDRNSLRCRDRSTRHRYERGIHRRSFVIRNPFVRIDRAAHRSLPTLHPSRKKIAPLVTIVRMKANEHFCKKDVSEWRESTGRCMYGILQ